VFVCWPNNAGSTLAERLLARAPDVASLGMEGQMVPGFDQLGPVPMRLGAALLFTEVADRLANRDAYDWPAIRALWNRAWDEHRPDAPVRLEKSTPNVCRAHLLVEQFPPAMLVLGWRDPYAQVDGILRARKASPERAARHVLECLRWQRRNLDHASACGVPVVAVSYEALCADPAAFCRDVAAMTGFEVPDPPPTHDVKGIVRPIADLNAEQVERFGPKQLRRISAVLAEDEALVRSFGYELR
jgi:hypothetical protein